MSCKLNTLYENATCFYRYLVITFKTKNLSCIKPLNYKQNRNLKYITVHFAISNYIKYTQNNIKN